MFCGTRPKRKVVPYKRVEGPLRATEKTLNLTPVGLIQTGLFRLRKAHQDEVTDQVGLAQIHASRVQALEYKLRVVSATIEGDIDDN